MHPALRPLAHRGAALAGAAGGAEDLEAAGSPTAVAAKRQQKDAAKAGGAKATNAVVPDAPASAPTAAPDAAVPAAPATPDAALPEPGQVLETGSQLKSLIRLGRSAGHVGAGVVVLSPIPPHAPGVPGHPGEPVEGERTGDPRPLGPPKKGQAFGRLRRCARPPGGGSASASPCSSAGGRSTAMASASSAPRRSGSSRKGQLMRKWNRLIACVLMPSAALAVSGCALFSGTPTTESVVVGTSLKSFRPISTRPGDTCETMREAAAHNSVYHTKKSKERKVYCAPCDCPELYPKPPAAKPAAPDASSPPKVS